MMMKICNAKLHIPMGTRTRKTRRRRRREKMEKEEEEEQEEEIISLLGTPRRCLSYSYLIVIFMKCACSLRLVDTVHAEKEGRGNNAL